MSSFHPTSVREVPLALFDATYGAIHSWQGGGRGASACTAIPNAESGAAVRPVYPFV